MTAIERALVTSTLVANLTTLGFPVGDNSAPGTDYGWQGEPDAADATFIPWLSISPMPGQGQFQDLSSLSNRAEWQLTYSVFAAGVNREQCERLADRARNQMVTMGRFDMEGQFANWRIVGIECPSLGSCARVGEAIPYYYTQTDTYRVWVTQRSS